MTEASFRLLKNRAVLDILDGDKKYGYYELEDGTKFEVSMPYLSGSYLCNLSTLFGLPVSYPRNNQLSRWQYLDNLLEYCIKNQKCSNLLAHMFSISQFSEQFKKHGIAECNKAHKIIVDTIIEKINEILSFSGNKLVVVGNSFTIHPTGSNPVIDAPAVKTNDRDYIRDLASRAVRDIEQGDYDSSITKSRTLLEETFIYVIEKKNELPSERGDIGKLYKHVKTLYNMHPDANTDKRIKTLFSGLNSIVSAIAEIRNNNGDAHGIGNERKTIEDYHARLVVNSAVAMSDFILSVQLKNT